MEENKALKESWSKLNTITLYEDDRDRRYISTEDLIISLIENTKNEQRIKLIEYVVAQAEFGEAVTSVLNGTSNEECSTWRDNQADSLRKALIPYANEGVKELVQNLINENLNLREKLEESKKRTNKILEDWPESYKKYIPKETFVYAQGVYGLTDSKLNKLIDFVKEKE